MCNKRLAVLFGSPSRHGNTGRLLDSFLAGLPAGIEAEIASAYEWNMAPCRGCGFCREHQGCALPDFPRFDALLRGADYLAVATPVYNLSFPAPLKAMLDRTQCYYNARFCRGIRPPLPKRKPAVLLVTADGQGQEGVAIMERQLNMIFTILNAELVWTVRALGTGQHPVGAAEQELAAQAARKLLLP